MRPGPSLLLLCAQDRLSNLMMLMLQTADLRIFAIWSGAADCLCFAGGVLDDRDAAADLRDRLQRELDARETP